MESILDQIRAAVADDATPEARAAGVAACRAILTALEAAPGRPMAAPVIQPATPIAQMVGAMRGMPVEQLLDLAIARLRAALPAGTETSPVPRSKIQIVSIPPVNGQKP